MEIQNKKNIRFSVVIPAYNIEGYIARAINSVLAQTRPADEIIVVDDGSVDGTAEVIKSFGDKVRYIYQENRGLSGARNTGIRNAQYEWIAFLDGDDEWLPNHLCKHEEFLQKQEGVSWLYSNYYKCLCTENRKAIANPYKRSNFMKKTGFVNDFFDNVFYKVYPCPQTIVINASVFKKIGYFDEEQSFAEDIDMWYKIAYMIPEVGYISEPTAIYHLERSGSLMHEYRATKMPLLMALYRKHIELAKKYDRDDKFDKVAAQAMKMCIRSWLFYDDYATVKSILDEFGYLMSLRYKLFVRLLMVSPKLTSKCCFLISKFVRKFKLRKGVYRKP